MEQQLSPRNAEILDAIVQSYIETGEPVASRAISRRRRDHLSPASIRNSMADLVEMGYLLQPHTSAGRVPTEKAFRSYVSRLTGSRVLAVDLDRLRDELKEIPTLGERMERSTQMLTEMTRNVGLAAAIPTSSQTLDQIELLSLGGHRVLMIVVTRDHAAHNQVVLLDEPITQDELASIRNYVNQNFSGWVLSAIRTELLARLNEESASYDRLMRRLLFFYEKGLLDLGMTPQVYMEGTFNLMAVDLHLTREKMRELFHALEEKKRILQMLDVFFEQPSSQVNVQVGLGDFHPSLRDFSLIGVSLLLSGGLSAKVAVLGPMRMNYPKVIAAVNWVGGAFRSLPV
jgi:heat-inducible transcriptional repressor